MVALARPVELDVSAFVAQVEYQLTQVRDGGAAMRSTQVRDILSIAYESHPQWIDNGMVSLGEIRDRVFRKEILLESRARSVKQW